MDAESDGKGVQLASDIRVLADVDRDAQARKRGGHKQISPPVIKVSCAVAMRKPGRHTRLAYPRRPAALSSARSRFPVALDPNRIKLYVLTSTYATRLS